MVTLLAESTIWCRTSCACPCSLKGRGRIRGHRRAVGEGELVCFGLKLGQSLAILRDPGQSWMILGDVGQSWMILDDVGQSWATLGNLGQIFVILDDLG